MERLPVMVVLATFILLLLAPAQSQSTDSACVGVDCQQGKCVVLTNNSYPTNILSPYQCQCNMGWTTVESIVTSLPLLLTLPCTVPNCTMNLGCSGSPSPAIQAPPNLQNISSPCSLPGICGNGQCIVTDWTKYPPMYKCTCNAGYGNVGNLSAGYCLNPCSLGTNCAALGITVQSTSSPNAGSKQVPLGGGIFTLGVMVIGALCLSLLC